MRVAIAADPITYPSGLSHFLGSGLKWLARLNPTWEFHAVVTSEFASAYRDLVGGNVTFYVWNKTPAVGLLRRYVKVKGRERAIRLMEKYLPSVGLRKKLGNLHAIWGSLPEFDVLWVPHFDLLSRRWPVLYEKGFIKRPVLFTIYDIQPVFFPEDWSSESLANFFGGLVPLAKRCGRIITHNNFQKSAITKYLGVEPGKVAVAIVPPLLDQDIIHDIEEVNGTLDLLHRRYGITKPYMLYPGSTGYSHKNHVRLILAWHDLKSRMQKDCPTLVCTVKGQRWQVLSSLIEGLGLQEDVIFTGLVPIDHLSILYRLSSFIIVPTLYEGGGSGPVSEGILLGKPVICSRIPPIEEQLDAYNVTGVTFFDPTDIGAIADAVQTSLWSRKELEGRAERDQRKLAQAIPGLWKNWAAVYSRELARLVQEGS